MRPAAPSSEGPASEPQTEPWMSEFASQGAIRLPSSVGIAARSILESQAIEGTIASVVADRALDHHREGLFQYAAIRVGLTRASALVARLEQPVEKPVEKDDGEASETQSPRALLYRRMRALLRSESQSGAAQATLPWWPVPEAFREGFESLRAAFDASQAEVLELRFSRRLTDEEVAYVVEVDLAEVKRIVIVGLGVVSRLFGRNPASRGRSHEGILLEAFALDPEHAPAPRSARRALLSVGDVIAGRYEVEGLLGVGAFADVYRARDCDVHDHVVALKVLRTRARDARSVDAALRELQHIASVFHPSIVQLKDHGWHDARLWFVMPLYRGETLATRLSRGPLSRREAREIFEPLAEALAAMHRAGVRHQDVKPENVFLATLEPDLEPDAVDQISQAPDAGRRVLPVLLDLGVAAKDAELVLAGTPAYFAPEVAARFLGVPDPAPVGPKADVFSLALTLRQALSASAPERVAGGAVDAFVAFRATHAPTPPAASELRDLRPYFERWLARSPDARPTADELQRELAVLTRPAERRARRLAILRWLVPVSFAVLAVFGAVVYVLSREASLRKLEAQQASARAERAGERAASFYVSLTEQAARRKELEADVARLEEQYQSSRMTREQLASRLAQTEGELEMLSERERAQVVRTRQQLEAQAKLEAELGRSRTNLESAEARANTLSTELSRERTRSQDQSASVTAQLLEAQRSANEARARVTDLERRLARSIGVNTAPPIVRPGSPGHAPKL